MTRMSLRLPDGLYTRIKAAAGTDHRSLHAEILWLLERGLNTTTESASSPP